MPRITMLDETSAPAAPTTVASANAARVMRINCGADQPYVDRSGNQWEADRGFDGGEPLALSVPVSGALPTADDSALYQSGRCGEAFTYTIPVAPGLYALRLKFAECVLEWSFMRPFDLEINGRIVLRNFDVCHAARAPGRALDRVFRHLVPDADGQIVLRFRAGWEPLPEARPEAVVQAIELLPEEKSELRIAAGAETPYIDWNSFVWEADTCCRDGRVIRSDSPVDQASPTLYDQALYQTARSGRELRYELPAAPGLYTVHLKFAELWLQEPGQRPMDIEINGNPIQKSWDPAAFVGCTGMAIDLRAENITPDADDRIALVIRAAGEHDAILQAVELV
jgi:hypothetical protein